MYNGVTRYSVLLLYLRIMYIHESRRSSMIYQVKLGVPCNNIQDNYMVDNVKEYLIIIKKKLQFLYSQSVLFGHNASFLEVSVVALSC